MQVTPVNTCSSKDETEFHDLTIISEKIKSFFEERKQIRDATYRRFLLPGMCLLGFGAGSTVLFLILYAQQKVVTAVFDIGCSGCMLIIVCGVILMSLAPRTEISFEEYVLSSRMTNFSLNFQGILSSLLIACFPPYSGFLSFLLALVMMANYLEIIKDGSIFQMKLSFSLSVYAISYNIHMILYSWFVAIFLTMKVDVNALVLAGDDTIDMDIKLIPQWFIAAIIGTFAQYFVMKKFWTIYCFQLKRKDGNTSMVYDAIYALLFVFGSMQFCAGLYKLCRSYPLYENTQFLTGVVVATPVVIVLKIGRKNVFHFLQHRFEKYQRHKDGGFLAELLETSDVSVGDLRWVHRRSLLEKDNAFDEKDFRYHWARGRVISVSPFVIDTAYSFVQDIDRIQSSSHPNHKIFSERLCQSMSAQDLISYGVQNLRCIEGDILLSKGENFFNGSIRETGANLMELFSYSRDVNQHEKIDFFISHSWYDSHCDKYAALKRVTCNFFIQYKRYPTFWFDKVCINQHEISNGLRVLPITIMSCEKMLILCGKTYLSRLWCVWELFTLVTFQEGNASYMLQVECLEKNVTTSSDFNSFKVECAHCYDPNEEKKVLNVVKSVGIEHFENTIRDLGKVSIQF